jgi:hypothetical protein
VTAAYPSGVPSEIERTFAAEVEASARWRAKTGAVFSVEEIAAQERALRAQYAGSLVGEMGFTHLTAAQRVRFLKRMNAPHRQGRHDEMMRFTEPLDGWIDRDAFETVWRERTATMRAIKPAAVAFDLTSVDDDWDLRVFSNAIYVALDPVMTRLTTLCLSWTDWDGRAPLPAPDGTVNPEFLAAEAGGQLGLQAWSGDVLAQFQAVRVAGFEPNRLRRPRPGLVGKVLRRLRPSGGS